MKKSSRGFEIGVGSHEYLTIRLFNESFTCIIVFTSRDHVVLLRSPHLKHGLG